MRFLGLEMARAEKCTKSSMFNQMLVRDWDAHSVADTAKEKGELRKSTGVFYLVSLTDHITSCTVNHCKIHSTHRNEVDALPELLHKDQSNFILYWNCLFEKDRLLVYAESVYLVIFSLFQFHTFPNFSGRNQLKSHPVEENLLDLDWLLRMYLWGRHTRGMFCTLWVRFGEQRSNLSVSKSSFYRTRVRSLAMLVSDSLTDSLTHWLTPV